MSLAVDKKFIVANLGYRIQMYHPGCKVQIGVGNTDADIVVVQPHMKMPEKDAITGALKRFGMLGDAYRATSQLVELDDKNADEINRYFLRELIGIIQPLVVVACGPEVMALLRQKKVRSFKTHTGKKFKVQDLTKPVLYATLNPTDYGYARAPQTLKAQGKEEWTKLAKIYRQLKEKSEKDRWGV